ncbi:hypothetical protein EVAR_40894_1 [Eumeta japonica]|uniref:Uncharacterized protein n=1 Tax=Eumeta variegata TaxID=151549 RepID=A0A4C1X7J8_EUMVA|nr:hypothetical protein EVAR_40894_1 [Eumeta japonica]
MRCSLAQRADQTGGSGSVTAPRTTRCGRPPGAGSSVLDVRLPSRPPRRMFLETCRRRSSATLTAPSIYLGRAVRFVVDTKIAFFLGTSTSTSDVSCPFPILCAMWVPLMLLWILFRRETPVIAFPSHFNHPEIAYGSGSKVPRAASICHHR